MQEIYNVGGQSDSNADDVSGNTISRAEPTERFACAVCMERPMWVLSSSSQSSSSTCALSVTLLCFRDSVLLPCRHLAFCSSCAVAMKLHNALCPFCRKPYLVVLQVFFLKKRSECVPYELNAANSLAAALEQEKRANTYSNETVSPGLPLSESISEIVVFDWCFSGTGCGSRRVGPSAHWYSRLSPSEKCSGSCRTACYSQQRAP